MQYLSARNLNARGSLYDLMNISGENTTKNRPLTGAKREMTLDRRIERVKGHPITSWGSIYG